MTTAGWGLLDPRTLALRLTLLDLLLRPIGRTWVRPAVLALAGAGLVLPPALREPVLWLSLAACAGWRVVSAWPLGDNHAYLLTYWCLAVAIALALDGRRLGGGSGRAGERALDWNARMLVGLAFALAVLWKVLSPDYLDGRFFRVILTVDPRFESFAELAGGKDPATLESHRAFLTQHVDAPGLAAGEAPVETARFRAVAIAATYGTFALELAIALAFLLPFGRRLRDGLLLAFCLITYAVAPVEAFGWLVLPMGLAQCDPSRTRMHLAYLAVFAVLILYRELPPARLALELTGG